MTVLRKFHRTALSIGQAAIVQDLQQHVEQIRMRLLDLVEQDHLVRAGAAPIRSVNRLPRIRHNPEERRSDAPPNAFPCTPTYRRATSRSRRRTGTAPGPWSVRSCRRRWGPGTGSCPIGRCGSCNPARDRRTAADTAATASSWPMTRLPSSASMLSSLPRSPSSILSTGTPVQRDTTPAMFELGHSPLSTWLPTAFRQPAASAAAIFFSRSGMMPYSSSPALAQSLARFASAKPDRA